MICLIINTAEYCAQTAVGMADTVKKLIDPKYQGDIDLKEEQSEFDG